MAPRNRDPKNARLSGTNIKVVTKGARRYYYYQMPDGSLEALVHDNEQASVEAAHALNRALRPSGRVVERILAQPPRPTTRNPLAIEVLDQFEREWLPAQNYSDRSLYERKLKLRQYRKHWPHQRIGDLDTFMVAQFLRQLSAESARQHRVLLDQLFRFSASEGYQTQRPMVDIERRKQEKRRRARHTWDGHMAIYEAAEPWLQRAIRIALLSLQRRSDLVSIHVENQIDLKSKTIQILQQKSANYDEPVFINISMGDELLEAVRDCIWSGINCPYLIRHRPKRITKAMRESRPHVFSVPPDYLTRAYSRVRDKVGAYDHLPTIERPGIHSLRALGIWLYTKAGYPDDYIMALAGHATQRMKAHYTEGHEKPVPVTVNADLSLSSVDLSNIDWETDLSAPLKALADSSEG